MNERYEVKDITIHGKHIMAMGRHMYSDESDEVLDALDTIIQTGSMPRCMTPISRIMLYWILDSNGIDPYTMPTESEE